MSIPADMHEVAFSVEGDFVPMPQARVNRHGQLRIPSDHPVHDQKKRIRQAARAAGAMPLPDVCVEIQTVIYGDATGGKTSPVMGAIKEALEGVAFKEAWQVFRWVHSFQLQKEGETPCLTVVIRCSKSLFDTF